MNLISLIKSKMSSVIIVVLITLLAVSYISGKTDRNTLVKINNELLTQTLVNKQLVSENQKLYEDLKNVPDRSVEVVKEVYKEICSTDVKKSQIEGLPSKRTGVDNETHTVDIDDRLPDDLIRLLK